MPHSDPKEKIVHLIRSSTPEPNPTQGTSSTVNISGDGNIVGNGNTIVNTERHTTRTIAKTEPGTEHITEAQVRRLHDLKDEIIRLENIAKKRPATYQSVWVRVNKLCGVATMRLIPLEKFKKAETFMLQWIARLTGTKSVKKKDPNTVRTSRLRAIHAKMRAQGTEEAVRAYMRKKFSKDSMSDLTPEELEQTYRYTMSKK